MGKSLKITLILLGMFFLAQLIGIFVASQYQPTITQEVNQTTGQVTNKTQYNIPFGLAPPEEIDPGTSVISFIIALFFAVLLVFLLMRLRAETVLKAWFFIVVVLGLAIALQAFVIKQSLPSLDIAGASLPLFPTIAAVILAYGKVIKRNIIVHNATELLIYPGIAAVFIPLLNIWAVVVLLLLISAYDIYAVWHAGFMQKMARYQIEKLRIFSGFFIPHIDKKEKKFLIEQREKGKKVKKIPVNVAILGGGDVIFPMILAGVALPILGLVASFIIALGATIALAILFYISQRGMFYPAMPFISAGCLLALGLAYLI